MAVFKNEKGDCMRSFLRVSGIILLVAWMGIIFFFSHQTAQDSSEISGSFIEIVAEKLYPDFENLSESEKADVVASFQFTVRKSAHAGAFALLGFFAFLTFVSYTRMRYWLRIFWAAAVSLIYAASDEIHQHFIEGRSCELRDFLIDAAGITLSLLFWFGIVKAIGPWRRKTAFVPKKAALALETGADALFESVVEKHKADIKEPVLLKEDVLETIPSEVHPETEETVPQSQPEITENIMEEIPVTEMKETQKETSADLSYDMQYAASAIGKVVVEVSKICDKLADSSDPNKKELINLALGRSEVFKSRVLYIVQSEADSELKQKMIEKEKTEAFDYFDSIIAQTR